MSQFLTAKPPSLGHIRQYSVPDTSSSASSSLRSHASSLFDKITPTSTASFGSESPASTPLPSPVEEKKDLELEPAVEGEELIPELELGFTFDEHEHEHSGNASVMPLIDYAPDHSVDINAITPESMELVMRLQDLGCELDAGTLLNNISGVRGKGRAPNYEPPLMGVCADPTEDWLAFIRTIMPDFDVIAHKHLFDVSSNAIRPNTPPPPAPRLQATQLPLDDIPEMSLLDSFLGIDEQVSDLAASLKAADVRTSACGGPAVATPASLLFGIQPEPVSMQVQMPAFGFSGSGIDGCVLSLVRHLPLV
ncbi:hypothetical protein FA13DRAFT_589442 [Coprinellus micaceus]|uniref:Uncharacterized protein n=1 Tax=Coprinellus micaceus TaxID=71717 RepID=A0A4Y7SAP1_COPMI|nr:hypothetical protein FA13DRAFT_589442 [Coprinellus micaceus]